MANINDVVTASVRDSVMGVKPRDFGAMLIVTPESGEAFNDEKTRYVKVRNLKEVQSLFGTDSVTSECAKFHFMLERRANTLIIGRWNKDGRTIEPTKNSLKSATITDLLIEFKQITSGSMDLRVGSGYANLSGIDFSGITSFNDVADILNKELSDKGLSVSYDQIGRRFIINSQSSGVDEETVLGYAEQAVKGEYIGGLLKLEDGQATISKGQDQIILKPEGIDQALFEIDNETKGGFVGFTFADQLTDEQIETCADFAKSYDKAWAVTAIKDSQLENEVTNPFKRISDKANDRTLAVYSENSLYSAVSALSGALSVNYNGSNTMRTAKFKPAPGVMPDELSATKSAKAKSLGLNTYELYDSVPMLAEGTMVGKKWIDQVIGLMWFRNAVQVEVFNTFLVNDVVPYTEEGASLIKASIKTICKKALNNGFIAPGIWNKRGFGELKQGDFLENGYYIYSTPLDLASMADREGRKPLPFQVALKLSGAMHFADILIDFDH